MPADATAMLGELDEVDSRCGIDQVNQAVMHMDNTAQQTAAPDEQTSAAPQSASKVSDELKQQSANFMSD